MAPTSTTRRGRLARLLERCRDDPSRFNDVILGRPSLWSKQREVADAIARHKTIVVPAGNSVGKSYLSATILLWWLFTRRNSLAIVTAPSHHLLSSVTFKELRRAHQGSRIPLGGKITQSPGAATQSLSVDGTGWGLIGFSTTSVERASGQHAPELLALVDEASGIENPEIWDAIRSWNPSILVVMGNPLRSKGEFRELYRRALKELQDPGIPDRHRTVAISIPSTLSPDIHLERSKRGLADAGFIREVERTYGRDSLYWRTHIAAEFPDETADNLLQVAWLDLAVTAGRSRVVDPKVSALVTCGNRRISADLGEGVGRDRTVLVVRDDLGVLEVLASNTWGLAEAAVQIANLARKWAVSPRYISYDALGIGRDLRNHLDNQGLAGCRPYKGAEAGGDGFVNLRSAAAWAFRQRIDPDRTDAAGQKQPPFAIPPSDSWPALRDELLALTYDLVGGKTRLIRKEDLKAVLGHSPDYADALLQSFAMR